MPQVYEGERREIKLSDRVTVEVRELNADEAEMADLLAGTPANTSNVMIMRAISATRAFYSVTKINGEAVPPVVDSATLRQTRRYFSAREAVKLMDEYADLYLLSDEERNKLRDLSQTP